MVTAKFDFSSKGTQNLKTIASNSLNSLSNALFAQIHSSKKDILYKNLIAIPNKKIKNFVKNCFIHDLSIDIFTNLHFSSLLEALLSLANQVTPSLLLKPNRHITYLHILHLLKKRQNDLSIHSLALELNHLIHQDPIEKKSSPYDTLLNEISMSYPLITTIATLLDSIKEDTLTNFSLHIFAPFSLAPIYKKLILHLSNFIPTTLYFLTPTKMFWTDLLSPSEIHYVKKHALHKGVTTKEITAFSQTAHQSHNILSSFGKTGKDLFSNLFLYGNAPLESFEDQPPSSLLEHIQYHLLHQSISPLPITRTSSISSFSAPSKRDEIQTLYAHITELLTHDMKPSDILVLAPNINDYAPFIESIFSCKHSFQIFDVSNHYNIDSSLLLLLNLIKEQFSIDALFSLLSHPQFNLPFEINIKQLSSLKKILQEKKFSWGFDSHFKKKTLKAKSDDSYKSWQDTMDEILEEAAYSTSILSLNDVTVFGSLMLLVQNLFHQCEKIESQLKTITTWIKDYKNLISTFLIPNKETEQFIEYLLSLKPLHINLPDALFSYGDISTILEQFFQQNRKSIKNRPSNGISFHTMQEGILSPHKAIFFLGLDEDAFPRKENLNRYFTPTIMHSDKDRYQILNALLMAKQMVSFSFVHIDESDKNEKLSSIYLRELFALIKKQFSVTIQTTKILPPNFQQVSPSALTPPTLSPRPIPLVTLFDLNNLLSNPLKLFANKSLNIHLYNHKESQEEIFCSYLEHSKLRNKYLMEPLNTELSTSSPLLKKCTLHLLQKEMEEFHSALNKHNICKNQILTISLEPTCKSILKEDKTIFVPSPLITIDSITLCIQGQIKLASSKGVVLYKNYSPQEVMKQWAIQTILFYLHANHKDFPITPQIIYLKSDKISPTPSSNPNDLLKELLNYYLLAIKKPSPLIPEYASHYLLEKEIDYKKAEEKSGLFVNCPYKQLLQPDLSINWRKHLPGLCNTLTA